jgi:hypothetical protein
VEWLQFHAFEFLLAAASITLGAAVSYYFFRKSQNNAELSYSTITDRMLSVPTQGLILSFKGQRVKNPQKDRIVVWNSGKRTIYRKQLECVEPPGFTTEGIQILQCNVSSATRKSINANVSINDDRTKLLVDFDFLDPNDGFVIEAIYEFTSKDKANAYSAGLKSFGTVIEVTKGLEYRGRTFEVETGYFSSVALLVVAIALFVVGYELFVFNFSANQSLLSF